MYVIVVGAGEVGSYVAERLSKEGHDVAMIECDAERLRSVEEHIDVLGVHGSGTSPRLLETAGVGKADLVVAVTSSDSVNLLVSLVAKQGGADRTVVRVEDVDLRSRKSRKVHDAVGADLVIDPDQETAEEILELLEFPGATEIASMADGEVVVMGARLSADAPAVGRTLIEIAREHEPDWDFLFGALSRGNTTVIPRGEQRLEANDLVRVVCKRRARYELAELLGISRVAPRRVMLLGGGRTAEMVALSLVSLGADVAVVERDPERARELAERLDRALVLQGDITDSDLLEEAEVASYDAVIALTGEDDANVLACLYARSEGAGETIAVVHRLSLLPLLNEAGIDTALSPRTASANGVLRFVRGGVAAVATFLEGEAEVLEVVVQKDSPADGAQLSELQLPDDVLVGAIVRDGKSQIGRGRSQLRARDHVVLFAMPSAVDAARQAFG